MIEFVPYNEAYKPYLETWLLGVGSEFKFDKDGVLTYVAVDEKRPIGFFSFSFTVFNGYAILHHCYLEIGWRRYWRDFLCNLKWILRNYGIYLVTFATTVHQVNVSYFVENFFKVKPRKVEKNLKYYVVEVKL